MQVWKIGCGVSLLLLAGCASSVSNGAQDGYQLGYHDGIKGVTERSYTASSRYSQADYDQGYESGVKNYCNSNAAYQIGLSGQDYQGVCDGMPDGSKFRLEWQRGWNDR